MSKKRRLQIFLFCYIRLQIERCDDDSMLQFRMSSGQTSPAQPQPANPRSLPQRSENLRSRSHWDSGLEVNLIELEDRVNLVENTFYARYTYWVNLTECQYSQLVGRGCLVQRCLSKHICGLALGERVFGQLVGNFCRIVRPDSPSPEYGTNDGGDDLKNDEGYFIHCEYPYPRMTWFYLVVGIFCWIWIWI